MIAAGASDVTHRGAVRRLGLLIEDNQADAEYVVELLRESPRTGLEVMHVERLAAAAVPLRAGRVEFVLLDLRLPDSEGVRCVDQVRAWAPNIPIVVLTGVDDDKLALACIAAGAQDYLPKQDLRLENLRRAIEYALVRVRERELQQRAAAVQARLAAIVDASRDAIVSLACDGSIESWNGGAEASFGFAADEVIGRPIAHVLTGWPALDDADGDGHVGIDVELRHRDGSPRTFSLVTGRLRGPGTSVHGTAAILRDVTETRHRDDELLRTNQALRQRDQQMRALAARLNAIREDERTRISREVHDELGQLLTGVKLDLRWIERRLPSSAAAELPGRITEAVALVDRTISTVQRLAVELRPSALDALGLPAALRDEARRFGTRAGVQMHVAVADECHPAPVVATALFRIFQELCTNVARHAHAASVTTTLAQHDDVCTMVVQDDGDGMPEAALTGRSLGLLGMTERAEALGGTIRFESSPGNGTTVRVAIPATPTSSPCEAS